MSDIIDEILKPGIFSELDRQFAVFMNRQAGGRSMEVAAASLLVSRFASEGSVCIDINNIAGRKLDEIIEPEEDRDIPDIKLPSKTKWIKALLESRVAGRPGAFCPMIVDNTGRLYLYRYHKYEKLLADNLQARLKGYREDIDRDILVKGIERLFPDTDGLNMQKTAAAMALYRNFCVISGGPGTGKTSTVFNVILLIIEQAIIHGHVPSIALAAPTGKAAARLSESIKNAVKSMKIETKVRDFIPYESFTVHRLLGWMPGNTYCKYNSENRLPYDTVILDESSMADLALMTRLVQAVPDKSRLILLGDRDQLSSVEAGAVLGDICGSGTEHGYSENFIHDLKGKTGVSITLPADDKLPPIADSIIILKKSYRFGTDSGIGELSQAVRAGRSDAVMDILKSGNYGDVKYTGGTGPELIKSIIEEYISEGYSSCLNPDTPEKALDFFNRFSILCALRRGPSGVQGLNLVMEELLRKRGFIDPSQKWYPGRPVMITSNNHSLKLYNGDVGIIFPDKSSEGAPRFFIPSPDGSVRKIPPLKLPEHETAYAVTVHKSQGSEYDHVLIILPDTPSALLTRELLYTAVTRARKKVYIAGNEDIIRFTTDRTIDRKSGLKDALWD